MADVATLVFDIDSSQARGAAKALADLNSAAIKAANSAASIGTTMRDANGRFQQAAKLTAENLHEVKSLAKSYNPLLAAQIRYKDEVLRTGAAVKAGVISDRERITYLKRLKSELDGTASAERKAASAREAARREFLPLYAASKEYEATLGRLNAALEAGDISATQHAAALKRINEQYASSAAAVSKFGQSQQVASHHVANLSFQLNDIGMMMAMGQNPFMLMIQQGPQVAQIFSQMNQEGRKIGPTLAGAFKMFLNPTTAVTLALIGGAAALGQWAFGAIGAGKEAKKLADEMSDLKSRVDDISSGGFRFDVETGKLKLDLDQIIQKYGVMNDNVQRHVALLQEATVAAAGYANINFMAAFEDTFSGTLGILTTRVDEVRIAFETTNDGARDLIRLMGAVGDARGISNQRQAAEDLRDRILQMTGGIQNMTAEQVKYFLEVVRAVDQLKIAETQIDRNSAAAIQAATETARWASETAAVVGHLQNAASLLSSIGGGAINRASRAAQQAVLDAGGSTIEIAAAGKRAESIGRLQEALQTNQITIDEYARLRKAVDEEASAWASLNSQIAIRADAEREASRSSRGGGGGAAASERRMAAELKAAEKGFQSLSELMEQNTLFEYAEYNKRQAQLDAALNKQLITRQNYEAMKAQLQTLYFGTEYEQQNLRFMMEQQQLDAALEQRRISEERHAQEVSRIRAAQQNAALSGYATFFGNMAQAAQAGGDRTSKIVKAFSIAQGILNSYLAYTQVLADPSLMGRPFLRTALAASTLAAGLGAVAQMKSGGGGGGVQSKASATQEPTRNVLVRLEGPDWMQDMASDIITQIHDQSKDGRLIISRDY